MAPLTWGDVAAKGLATIAGVIGKGKGVPAKDTVMVAAMGDDFDPPDLTNTDSWLAMGVSPPEAEVKGLYELYSEYPEEEEQIALKPAGQAPPKKAPVKNRRAYKKLAPYQPPVAAGFDPSMLAMMQAQQAAGGGAPAMPRPAAAPAAGPAPEAAAAAPGAEGAVATRTAGAAITLTSGMDPKIVSDKITQIAKDIIGDGEDIELDTPLMQAGITSNTAVILRDSLSQEIQGVNLPPTLMFDYPSVESITGFIMDKVG